MLYRSTFLLVVLAATACGPANNEANNESNNSTIPDANNTTNEGGPYWELGATAVTPAVTGTEVSFRDDQTIVLGSSTPEGWRFEFTADEPFAENGFYASDNVSDRVSGVLTGPDDTCSVQAGDDGNRQAIVQTATFEEQVPAGSASLTAVDCYDAPEMGRTWSVTFGILPTR